MVNKTIENDEYENKITKENEIENYFFNLTNQCSNEIFESADNADQTSHKNKQNNKNETIPIGLLVPSKIQHKESCRLLRVLFDSGGGKTMIHSSALPVGACPELLHKTLDLTTIKGTYKANRQVYLEDITLPEFDKTRQIDGVWAYVFETPCQHDIILG